MDKSRVIELKTALAEKVQLIETGMNSGVKVDGANVEVSTETAESIRTLMAEAKSIKALIDAEMFGTETKAWLDAPARDAVALDTVADMAAQRKMMTKSIGEMFTDSEEFKALIKSGGAQMQSPFAVEVNDLPAQGRKDIYGAMNPLSMDRVFGSIQFDAPVPRGHRALRHAAGDPTPYGSCSST